MREYGGDIYFICLEFQTLPKSIPFQVIFYNAITP